MFIPDGQESKAMEKNANILKRFLSTVNGQNVIRIPARQVKTARFNVVIRSA